MPISLPHFSAKGFSLIELLIVVTVIAVITAGIIPFTTRYASERQLLSTVEELFSTIQLHQSNATQGVSGSWYGVEINSAANTFILLEVNNPTDCPITLPTIVRNTAACITEIRSFDRPVLTQSDIEVITEVTYGTNLPQPTTNILEARFNRSPRAQEIVLLQDAALQAPDLQRLRITFQLGNRKRMIVIDGGNICTEEIQTASPSPCNSSPTIGGPKIGRIFLVENV